jgi:hypothetical protein
VDLQLGLPAGATGNMVAMNASAKSLADFDGRMGRER